MRTLQCFASASFSSNVKYPSPADAQLKGVTIIIGAPWTSSQYSWSGRVSWNDRNCMPVIRGAGIARRSA
jgi:hypothetical protein